MERGETGSCPFRYQGQYEDKEIGVYYNRFRYYSPEEGRYISQDPIRLGGGDRLYGYVKDTTTWVDVLGLSAYGPNATQRRQIETLRIGTDVYVKTIEEARDLLKHMPELRPHADNFPSESGKLFKGTIFADVWKQPNGTFRGDLVNTSEKGFSKYVHNPLDVPESPSHAFNPHYNIRFLNDKKAAIVITN